MRSFRYFQSEKTLLPDTVGTAAPLQAIVQDKSATQANRPGQAAHISIHNRDQKILERAGEIFLLPGAEIGAGRSLRQPT